MSSTNIKKKSLSLFSEIVFYFPTTFGVTLRRFFFKLIGGKTGSNLIFGYGCNFFGAESINLGNNNRFSRFTTLSAENQGVLKIGDNISVNSNTVISASDGGMIEIGNKVLIAQNVIIRASNHCYSDTSIAIQDQGHVPGKIIIRDGVWIAANVVITANVIVGEHSIIAAGSVVTKNLPSYGIYGGIPAKLIKSRL